MRAHVPVVAMILIGLVVVMFIGPMLYSTSSEAIPTPTVTTIPNLQLAFAANICALATDDYSPYEIYIMDFNGQNLQALTTNVFDDSAPTWSPDGQQLAFVSDRDGHTRIYMMNGDGSAQRCLTCNQGSESENMSQDRADSAPDWSPDGERIAFVSSRSGVREIYTIRINGTGTVRLREGMSPAWSPDGAHIAYDVDGDIYIMDADGNYPMPITHDEELDSGPAWSPEGSQIAFWSRRESSEDIYIMAADGSDMECLSCGLSNTDRGGPSWSPDGRYVAFAEPCNGYFCLVAMDLESRARTPLLVSEDCIIDFGLPAWRPQPGYAGDQP